MWASETVPKCASGVSEGWWDDASPNIGSDILAANSCTNTLALAEVLSWTRVLELAASDRLELPTARVVPLANGRLHAANAASVETLVAAALLDVSATVQVRSEP